MIASNLVTTSLREKAPIKDCCILSVHFLNFEAVKSTQNTTRPSRTACITGSLSTRPGQNLGNGWNGKDLIVVVYPSENIAFLDAASHLLKNRNIILIDDLGKAFAKWSREELTIEDGTHPSSLVHRIVAERLYSELKNILPPTL
jgi:lysophospholipase L1-like esterase